MYSDAEAFVVIAYFYDTYRFRSTIGQAFQVETSLRFLLRNEFCCDGQLSGDYLVYDLFQLLYFFFRGAGGKTVVQLAFLPFYVLIWSYRNRITLSWFG